MIKWARYAALAVLGVMFWSLMLVMAAMIVEGLFK
jgi:hypothetical protein